MSQKKSSDKAQPAKTKLHYRLAGDEWIKSVHDLKPSELVLLYHLRTLDPFGDRILDLQVTSLAKTLRVHKSTISRALQVLKIKGYIDLELTSVRVRLRNCIRPTLSLSGNLVASEQQALSSSNKTDCNATDEVPVQQSRLTGNEPSLKPLPISTSGCSQTIHTDHTTQTLSGEEREELRLCITEHGDPTPEFRGWLIKKAAELPNRPVLLERWVEEQVKAKANQKDFLKQRETRGDKDPERFSFGEKIYTADPADILWDKILICRKAMDEGDRQRVLVILQSLWQDGRQDECGKICAQFPDWGIELGQHGPKETLETSKD